MRESLEAAFDEKMARKMEDLNEEHKNSTEKDRKNFKIFLTDKIEKVKQEAAKANRAHLESIKSRMMEKVRDFEKQKVAEYAKECERYKVRLKKLTKSLTEGENVRRDAEGESARREELQARLRELTESLAEEERARVGAARGSWRNPARTRRAGEERVRRRKRRGCAGSTSCGWRS